MSEIREQIINNFGDIVVGLLGLVGAIGGIIGGVIVAVINHLSNKKYHKYSRVFDRKLDVICDIYSKLCATREKMLEYKAERLVSSATKNYGKAAKDADRFLKYHKGVMLYIKQNEILLPERLNIKIKKCFGIILVRGHNSDIMEKGQDWRFKTLSEKLWNEIETDFRKILGSN